MDTATVPPVVRADDDGERRWFFGGGHHTWKVRAAETNGANQFAVHYTFELTRKATGQRTTIEEVGVYTVNNDDKITREQFFYDGEH